VSRALRPGGKVSAATRARVQAAAEQLGYTPNAIARSLITQRTDIIGIVTADITIPFQPFVLEKFLQRLQSIGRQVLIFTAAPGQEVDDLLPTALQYQVDALIVTSATLSSRSIIDCSRSGTHVVLFSRSIEGQYVSAVTGDNVAAGAMVADFLLDFGHQRLGYIAGDPNSSTNHDREQGFTTRLWERGAARPLREAAEQLTYEAGRATVHRLLDRPSAPDAVFCASDIIALGAIDGARESGCRVPEDLSIVGFDDIPMARWNAYDLTTVRLPVDEMVEETVRLATAPSTGLQDPVTKLFAGTLVQRGSTIRRTDTRRTDAGDAEDGVFEAETRGT
jgi:DNA-binding LacI/PurR family transcriptional regulator